MNKKKVFSLLLSIAVLGSTFPTAALAVDGTSTTGDKTEPGYVDDNNGHPKYVRDTFDFVVGNIAYSIVDNGVEVAPWYWSWKGHNCAQHADNVFAGSEYTGDTITIPSEVTYNEKTYNVVGIGDAAFANASGYTVIFPNSENFTYIGNSVFSNTNPNMTSVTIPASVTHIGDYSFALNTDPVAGEESIDVVIPENSKLQVIGDYAFANNSAVKELDFPDTLTTIGQFAFSKCTSLASITIPASVTNLETATFDNYYNAEANDGAGNVSFAEGSIFKIQDGVLYDNEWLIRVLDWQENVVVPDGIKYIGADAFNAYDSDVPNAENILKSITFPESLVSIGNWAFRSCKALTNVIIPKNVAEIGTGAFNGCTGLTTAAINGPVTELNQTFNGCTNLETVTLPETIEVIGSSTFNKCAKLTSLDFSNVKKIGNEAFAGTGLTSFIGANELTEIGENAFQECPNLQTVIYPEGIGTVPYAAFVGCTALSTVILPGDIREIGSGAFYGAFASGGSLVMQGTAAPSLAEMAFNDESSLTVYYPAEAQEAYQTAGLIEEGDTNGYALSLTDSSMALASGENSSTLTLNATVPTGMTLVTTSSNPAVATAEGSTITGVTEGTATITAQLKVGEYVVLEDSCTVTVTAEGAVIPTVEEPVTNTDKITETEDKNTAGNVAGSVAADETITSAAQSAANSLNSSAEKATLISQGEEKLNPGAGEEVSLYTQTYLNIEATELTKEDTSVTSITLNITPMMQVVASTATNSADVNLAEGGNAVVVKNPAPLTIRNASEITVTLPNNFASQTVYVKHQASNGGTYFYQATADSTGKVTFTSTHGFSPFTFSLNNEAVAEVNGVGYASFQEAVNAAADNDVVEVFNDDGNLTATVSGSSRTIMVKNSTGSSITVTLNGQAMTIASGSTQDYTYTRPSGGGGSSVTTYAISTPSKVNNGTIKVSPTRASKGTTVTITVTPDEGYELAKLTVTDKNDDTVKLTDKGNGKYTFTMPASAVEVEVSFQEIVIEPVNPFVDVSTSDYYYDAVLWAVENGVTNGTSATTFGPDMAVSRAQMVTFLWRAHGSPKATGTNPFTDVSTSDYYYDAVLWAVANGVTNGTSATTFSPDMAVTRAQAVTFQWRAAGSPVVSGSSFGDVATDAYYVNAVTWAVANGITNGTGGNNFSPDVVVSRAQAVTFLYREQE